MWMRIAPSNACFSARSVLGLAVLWGLIAGSFFPTDGHPCAAAGDPRPASSAADAAGQPIEPSPENASIQTPDPGRLATRVLLLALHDAVWGPAVLCDVRQHIEFDGLQLTGIGKYVREGKGSGRMKLHLQFPGRSGAHALLQISDGHRLHTLEQLGENRRSAVVDLDQVRERLQITQASVTHPLTALYLAVGGPAESLRKIHGQYQFTDVQAIDEAGTRVWILRGSLRRTPPEPQPLAPIDQGLIPLNESPAMPSEVRLRIRQRLAPEQGELPGFWFAEAEFSRPQTAGVHKAFRTRIEWDVPRPLTAPLEPALFEYHASGRSVEDETPLYLPPEPVSVARRSPSHPGSPTPR
ncbi:MAG: hypothetical protein D6753_03235 [Planctomycetota bacterium]|nr:MAG: hypothetical protein D6753_03235 [Planctomycetota bacterium]